MQYNVHEKTHRKEQPMLFTHQSANIYKKELKAIAVYLFVLFSWFLGAHVGTDMILKIGAAMIVGASITAGLVVNERKSILKRTNQALLMYFWGIIGYKFLLTIFMNVPMEQWAQAIQVDTPQAVIGSFRGWINMVYMIFMIMTPGAFAGYLAQTINSFRSRRKVGDRRQDFMRTGKQSKYEE
jgi:hypothetical protein